MVCVSSYCRSARLDCPLFFFNDTATTEIYTLSLHDALPISPRAGAPRRRRARQDGARSRRPTRRAALRAPRARRESEEHTSELQSPDHLVCRLLLEKKKKKTKNNNPRQHPAHLDCTHLRHST